MENLKPLTDFFKAIEHDFRISTTHIAVYAALLHIRACQDFANPIEVFRCEIAPIAKITAPYTYHKYVKELNEYGYLVYEPVFKKSQRSRIYFPESVS